MPTYLDARGRVVGAVPPPQPKPETTPLTADEEQRFRKWAADSGITDIDHPDSHYDYRGLFKELGGKVIQKSSDRHFPDTYKQHGHPTFSIESKYSRGPDDGGRWNGDTFVQPQKQKAYLDQRGNRIATPTLAAAGLTGAEVKRRAAAGEPILQKGEGLRHATLVEAAKSGLAEVAAGVGEGLGGLLSLPADIATAPTRMAPAGIKAMREGRGYGAAVKESLGAAAEFPSSQAVTAAANDAERTFKDWMGVEKDVVTPYAPEINRTVGQFVAPLPEILGATPKKPWTPKPAEVAPRVTESLVDDAAPVVTAAERELAEQAGRAQADARAPKPAERQLTPAEIQDRWVEQELESRRPTEPGSLDDDVALRNDPEMERERVTKSEYRKIISPLDEMDVEPGDRYRVDELFDKNSPMPDRMSGWRLYDAFGRYRELLKKQHGDTIRLVRYDSPERFHRPDKTVLHWSDPADRDFLAGAHSEGGTRKLIERDVPIDDIVAAPSYGKGKRQEFIVLNRASDAVDDPLVRKAAGKQPPDPPKPPDGSGGTNGSGELPEQSTPKRSSPASNDSPWIRFREFIEDDWLRVKRMVDDPKAKVTEASDPYTAEILFHGRLGARIDDARAAVNTVDRDIVATAKRVNVPDSTLQADVDRYLHARHAPERNAAIGERAAGMSDDEARQIIEEIEASPHGAEVKRIATNLREINERTLDVLRDGEVITDELYDSLRTRYQNHVPLNRILDDTDDIGAAIGSRPMDVRSTGIRSAKGSERQVADITSNILSNYEQAIVRAEKNRVDLPVLRFARDNADLDLFTEIKPRAIGKTFDDKPILREINDPQVLVMREKGKARYLKVNDPKLAMALKGANRFKVDGVLRYIGSYTRFMSSLATRRNPDFLGPNKIRDLQEAAIYAFSKGTAKDAAKVVGRDAVSIKDVFDGIRGVDTPGARLYRQMKMDGGTTGGLGLSTREMTGLRIDKLRKVNRSMARRSFQTMLGAIDDLNAVFEDSTRLSVYKTALDGGASRQQAARMAKEASINFNKFGRGGPQINALYMFANASIQGSAKLLRAMKNPKVAASVIGGVGAAVAATAEWNDRIDPNWREHVSKYDRMSSLTVMLPPSDDGSANYIKVPVSWGLKPIKVAMDYAVDATYGKVESPADVASATVAATVQAYNPVGGTDVVSALTPSFADLPVEIGRNQKWSGAPIRPDWNPYLPESERYFDDLDESATGRMAISATQELSSRGIEVSPADVKYAYESLVGGAGRFASRTVTTATDIASGNDVDVNEVPFVNRFFERVSAQRIQEQAEKADEQAGIEAKREKARQKAREKRAEQE